MFKFFKSNSEQYYASGQDPNFIMPKSKCRLCKVMNSCSMLSKDRGK